MRKARSTSRPSKRPHNLPSRWAFKHGAYYYRPRADERALFDGKAWFRLGDNFPDALRAFADRKELEMGDSLASVIDRYRLAVLPTLKPLTRDSYGRGLDLLRSTLGENKLGLIKPQLVYQYLEEVAKAKTMNVANHQLKLLNAVLDRAVRWGAIPRNGIKGEVSYYGKRDGLKKVRGRYVEDWELEAWQVVSTPAQRAFAALAMLTGARKSDILQIVLQDERESGLRVLIRKGIGEPKEVIYRWTPALREAVDLAKSTRKHGKSMFLLTNRNGQCFVGQDGRTVTFDQSWRRTMQAAIDDPQNPLQEPFTRHDLRAKVGSDADTEHRAQQLLGHSSPAMTRKHYRRAVPIIDPTK